MQEFYFGQLKNHVMVESVIGAFWIDTKCMEDISFSLSIGNFMSFNWLLVLTICCSYSCVLLYYFISIYCATNINPFFCIFFI